MSIVILVRKGKTDKKTPALIHYRRYDGTAAQKLAAMDAIASAEDPLSGEWAAGPTAWRERFVPATGTAAWQEFPALIDIFPWQQPGCMHSRLWPIAPDEATLRSRWDHFVASDLKDREALYVTPDSGRSIFTKVEGLSPLANLKAGADPQPAVRYGFRSFDREWTYQDPRLAKTESPALWATVSSKQIFMVSLTHAVMSDGPCMTVTECVPDKHFFRGSLGGKNVMPLYRDEAGKQANITNGLPQVLASHLGIKAPAPEDIAAYVYAILSSPRYRETFAEELKTPGPRIPITLDKSLWNDAVDLGQKLLWLHTYATRFQGDRGDEVPTVPGIEWDQSVTSLPISLADIVYDPQAESLTIGNGVVSGVRLDVWEYKVSGMQVVRKWLGYRTGRGTGRASSSSNPLDRIRPTVWDDAWNDELLDLLRVLTRTLDLQGEQATLVDKICNGLTITAAELPTPKSQERKPPKV